LSLNKYVFSYLLSICLLVAPELKAQITESQEMIFQNSVSFKKSIGFDSYGGFVGDNLIWNPLTFNANWQGTLKFSRLIVQEPMIGEAGWMRGFIGQGIQYDFEAKQFTTDAGNKDFSGIFFENMGDIVFYNRNQSEYFEPNFVDLSDLSRHKKLSIASEKTTVHNDFEVANGSILLKDVTLSSLDVKKLKENYFRNIITTNESEITFRLSGNDFMKYKHSGNSTVGLLELSNKIDNYKMGWLDRTMMTMYKDGYTQFNQDGYNTLNIGSFKNFVASGYGTSYISFNMQPNLIGGYKIKSNGADNGAAIMYADVNGYINFASFKTTKTASEMGLDRSVTESNIKNNVVLQIREDKIVTREVEVKLDVWPDYVFKPDYKLKALNELELFIKENSHLPEVPKEAEVLENGVKLGEMNVLLLKKIEELTLYLIQQQKQIDELSRKVEQTNE